MYELNVKVSSFYSSNGNPVPNQFRIKTPDGEYFQSYDSLIAFKPTGARQIVIFPDWDYSVTTGKYRNQFLGENKAETERKLKSGKDYLYVNKDGKIEEYKK